MESDFQKDLCFKGSAPLNKARFSRVPGIKTPEQHKYLCSYQDIVSGKALVTSRRVELGQPRRVELGQHKAFTYTG